MAKSKGGTRRRKRRREEERLRPQSPSLTNKERRPEAEKIARRLFGVYNWQGMLTDGLNGPSGLSRLANNYLKKRYDYTKWRVGETKYADGTSRYWIKSL